MTNKHRSGAGLALLLAASISGTAFGGATVDRIRESGHVRFGYIAQAKPFTSPGANGAVEGYGAELCGRIASALKSQLALQQLAVDWVPVTLDSAAGAVAGGQVDVLCTPANATLARRKSVSFSIPTFAGGIRAVVRNDVTPQIREALENNPRTRPVWRGTPAQGMVEATRFATVAGTSSERWLKAKKASFKLNSATVSVPDYASGIKFLMEDKIDVFFAERDVALAAMDDKASQELRVLNRQITHEPLALALPRGDEDLRLLVDTVLSSTYSAPDFAELYRKYFGALDDANQTFFSWVTPAP
ncbi:MAG TPA: amino acid ABC transporter substrate-binding protein [Steroidobacteraceae bacterium]|nr:amino acid ABC transporter substrate-binding protein [Steroidobacteraceae bacterium]